MKDDGVELRLLGVNCISGSSWCCTVFDDLLLMIPLRTIRERLEEKEERGLQKRKRRSTKVLLPIQSRVQVLKNTNTHF
jgi:hypothetical protein